MAVLISTPPVEIRKTMALSYFHRGSNNMNYLLTFCSFQHYKIFGKINLVLFWGNYDQVIQ